MPRATIGTHELHQLLLAHPDAIISDEAPRDAELLLGLALDAKLNPLGISLEGILGSFPDPLEGPGEPMRPIHLSGRALGPHWPDAEDQLTLLRIDGHLADLNFLKLVLDVD
jgi:hypothetical protein